MLWRKPSLDEHPAFERLSVRHIAVGSGGGRLAVHQSGHFDGTRLPIICVPAYARNMADYAEFTAVFHRLTDSQWPIVLVDFQGRGRATSRRDGKHYTTLNDAADLIAACDALGIERGIFLGQGHGGQVLMAMAEHRARLLAGVVLIDAGPITDTPGLVRMRDNLAQLGAMRGAREFHAVGRQVYGLAHPGATDDELDAIALRTHMLSPRGKVRPLFDPALLTQLRDVKFDDVFAPQWLLYELLNPAYLMLVRTQLTDALQRATFERMVELREDAATLTLPGQGTPALLASEEDVQPIAEFAIAVNEALPPHPIVAG